MLFSQRLPGCRCQFAWLFLILLFSSTSNDTLGASAMGDTTGPMIFLDFSMVPKIDAVPPPPGQYWNQGGLDQLHNAIPINLFDEIGQPTGIKFSWHKSPADITQINSNSIQHAYVPTGQDIAAFDHAFGIVRTGGHFLFEGLTPGNTYQIWILTWTYSISRFQPLVFDVTGGGDWSGFVSEGGASLAINGVIGDPARTFDSYAIPFQGAPDGILRMDAVSGEITGVYGFALRQVPEPSAGFIVISTLCMALMRKRGYTLIE